MSDSQPLYITTGTAYDTPKVADKRILSIVITRLKKHSEPLSLPL